MRIQVLFAPAEITALARSDLGKTVCIVFDVLRATSTICVALASGAEAIVPIGEIAEAMSLRQRNPRLLLAGEREGVRIRAPLTGGIDFDLGNSPREFTREKVAGRTIAMTTTNGTRALRACARARMIFIGSFLNLSATAGALLNQEPENILIVCSGTGEEAAYEDTLGAGALCESLCARSNRVEMTDSAQMALRLYQVEQSDLLQAVSKSRNGSRLLSHSDLAGDVAFCLQRDLLQLTARLDHDGRVEVTVTASAAPNRSG